MQGKFTDIKGVLFDLDDTLYDFDDSHNDARRALLEFLSQNLGISNTEIERVYLKAREVNQQMIENVGSMYSRLLYIQKAIEFLKGKTDARLSLEAEDMFWSTFIRNIRPREGVMDFLRYLKSRGIKTAIVTNLTAQVQMKKIVKLGFDGVCDILVTSEEAGENKPGAKPFLLALEKLGIRASEAVMIGDDYEADVLGARNLGIRVIYLLTGRNSELNERDVLTVKNFAEIKSLFVQQ